ncbi:MAG: tRNA lysidine(34) synthetase TilS [Thermoanaerobaculia bacterium]
MDPVLAALRKAADTGLVPPGGALLLAVSGGADSMALLYGAAEAAAATDWRLSVGHVHHGLRGREADRDRAFVAGHARRLGLPFFHRLCDARGEARRRKLSPESAARLVRYEALAEMACEARATWIATAHQREDRIESLLLARLRGAGLAGLAGPRRQRKDGVVRPLLEVPRGEILQFLLERGIGFRRDASNGNLLLPRNRLRRELARLPGREREATLRELSREIETLEAERDRVEQEFLNRLRSKIHLGPGGAIVDASYLSACPPALQRRALEEAAAPFAARGRPPLTGREREEILRRLSEGRDFHFEAGRRIRFERRGPILSIRPRALSGPETLYDSVATAQR